MDGSDTRVGYLQSTDYWYPKIGKFQKSGNIIFMAIILQIW